MDPVVFQSLSIFYVLLLLLFSFSLVFSLVPPSSGTFFQTWPPVLLLFGSPFHTRSLRRGSAQWATGMVCRWVNNQFSRSRCFPFSAFSSSLTTFVATKWRRCRYKFEKLWSVEKFNRNYYVFRKRGLLVTMKMLYCFWCKKSKKLPVWSSKFRDVVMNEWKIADSCNTGSHRKSKVQFS